MIDVIIEVMAFVGVACTIGFVALVIIAMVDKIKDSVAKAKWKYKYKHRFDNPPTAKCYCKDCVWWSENRDCDKFFFGWRMADDYFCWMAEPRKHDTEKGVVSDD